MPVQEKKWNDLKTRFSKLGICMEKDLHEKSSLGSGRGGQKAQKTSNAIIVTHLKSKIQVSSHSSRSKDLNRFLAYRILCEKLEKEFLGIKTKHELDAEKARKQKKRRKRRRNAKETPDSTSSGGSVEINT